MKQIKDFSHKERKTGCEVCLGLGWLRLPDKDIKALVVACRCQKGRENAELRAIPVMSGFGVAEPFNQKLFMPQANPEQLMNWWKTILKISEEYWKANKQPKAPRLKNYAEGIEETPPWWAR